MADLVGVSEPYVFERYGPFWVRDVTLSDGRVLTVDSQLYGWGPAKALANPVAVKNGT